MKLSSMPTDWKMVAPLCCGHASSHQRCLWEPTGKAKLGYSLVEEVVRASKLLTSLQSYAKECAVSGLVGSLEAVEPSCTADLPLVGDGIFLLVEHLHSLIIVRCRKAVWSALPFASLQAT